MGYPYFWKPRDCCVMADDSGKYGDDEPGRRHKLEQSAKARSRGMYTKPSYMGVSKNRGTPKWMVYNGKPYLNG